MRRPSPTVRLLLVGLLVPLGACSGGGNGSTGTKHAPSTGTSSGVLSAAVPGIYAHTGVHDLSPAVAVKPVQITTNNGFDATSPMAWAN